VNKYKAAIIGCGRIASDFDSDPKRQESIATHAGAYSFLPETELAAAADLDANKLKAFGSKWGVNALYDNYEEMLDKVKPEVLSICTWNSTHYEICRKAVAAGVKAIFCEKPIADSLADADKMVELCERNGVVLAVNHSRRWDGMHQRIKAFITDGGLGEVQGASAYYTAGIGNTGTHLLDLIRYLLGDVTWLWSNFAGKPEAVDPTVDAFLYFTGGYSVVLQGYDVKNYLIFELDIYGSKGRIRIENSGYDASCWLAGDHPKFSGYKSLQRSNCPFGPGMKDVMVSAIRDVVGCIGTGRQPVSSGRDGRDALELICAIHESGKSGAKVNLPLQDRSLVVKSK
jgi:predicted dehydrogenase